ncbi:hypothetical protein PR001_g19081 [Phytophthora rubi]|uniref:Retrotransposon gag domain-containing protein n=1 Tax=Phytophthora rubi TaxID=129364 RepID=A0A6A3JWN1_9STRA|nr:hypothetical protein PR001_g19081 [Phytophthora rubi]
MTTVSEREVRAQRRSISREQTAATTQTKQAETLTVETDDESGTMTLETDEIRVTDTPHGQGGTDSDDTPRNDAAPGSTNRPFTTGAWSGGTVATGDALGGDGGRTTARQVVPTRGTSVREDAGSGMSHDGTGETGTGHGRTPPREPAGSRSTRREWAPQQPIVVREKAKTLKIANFKGLDDAMPITMWLKTVRAEVRRQAVTMGIQWRDDQLYHEVAAHLEGEAQRWFATVMETVGRDDESIGTLASMLRAKYMTRRTTPEVVDLLSARRQMRGERLLEYAQSLREIAEQGDISEDWLVSAFLKGMSRTKGQRTYVGTGRAHWTRPSTSPYRT